MSELSIVKELMNEYSNKKGYEDLFLQEEKPEHILEAIEKHYGSFSIKNFKDAMKNRTIFYSGKNMMKDIMLKNIEQHLAEKFTSKNFLNENIDDIIYNNIVSKDEMRDNAEDEIEEVKETFQEQLFISRKILERKNKKISFNKGNGENNVNGKIILSKGDLKHLGVSEEDREYNLYWLSNGDILISKEVK